jgi:hypothetical protein
MKIIVTYDPPAVPSNCFDWCAVDDSTYGGEPSDPIGYGPTREAAILELINQFADDLFPEIPSTDLCSTINPALWSAFCTLKMRPQEPSNVWTESDVMQSIDQMYEAFFNARTAAPV